MFFGRLLLCWLLAISVTTPLQASELLRIATSTSTQNSGLMDHLLPQFIADSGCQVKLYAVGTGSALRFGRVGEVDVLLVHAPEAEQLFVDQGYGLQRLPVMHNDFILVGPPQDPAGVGGMTDITAAFMQIATSGKTFISRGDDSGTHKKEMSIWQATGTDPYGQDWYIETGVSIGKALQIASEQQGYAITDRGTWLAIKNKLKMTLLLQGDKLLHNPYRIIAIDPARHQGINAKAASMFIDWIRSPRIQQLIGDYRVEDQILFIPDVID